ncbi:MAG: glycosyltransferase family 9 protein [Leptospirillum sp.]
MSKRIDTLYPPILKADRLRTDFSGTFFHLFGQGLGDTVNALRVQAAVQSLFPASRSVIYCDERWSEFLRRVPNCSLRFYPRAHDPRYPKGGVVGPEEAALKEIRNKPVSEAYLAYHSSPLPDQLARGESTQESIVRMLGLSRSIPEFRPLVPMKEEDWSETERILRKHGLDAGRYFLMAPHTWPSKDWGKKNFEALGEALYRTHGIPVLIAGLPELGALEFTGAFNLFGLPLPIVAGLIARSALFIGLDSGLSHLAAAFDLPLVILYSKGKIPAFEIRTHSPYASLVLETDADTPISVETVRRLVAFRLAEPLMKSPDCPACGRQMVYVIEASEEILNRRCVCGTQRLERVDLKNTHEHTDSSSESAGEGTDNPQSGQQWRTPSTSEELLRLRSWLNRNGPASFTVSLDIRNPYRPVLEREFPGRTEKEERPCFHWSLDGLFLFCRAKGYVPARMQNVPSPSTTRLDILFSKEVPEEAPLDVPWGGKVLRIPGADCYCSCFSWQSWATPIRWVALSKRVFVHEGARKAARIASIVFFMDPGVKTLKYAVRYTLRSLIEKTTNPSNRAEGDS